MVELPTKSVACPYCGESIDLIIDDSVNHHQRYVEDCWVCCRPIEVEVVLDGQSEAHVTCRTDSET